MSVERQVASIPCSDEFARDMGWDAAGRQRQAERDEVLAGLFRDALELLRKQMESS